MKTILIAILMILAISARAQNYYIAHRGASFDAPENTVTAANLAWELGADAVEIDVHLASDNRVVVIHDHDTKRTCLGKNLSIKSTPSMVLRGLDAGSWKDVKFKGERIPFLEEIIATIPAGKFLVIEIKSDDNILPHLKRVADKSGKLSQLVFISFNWDIIVALHNIFPENKSYWLSSSQKDVQKRLPEAAAAGLTGVNIHHSAVTEEIIAAASELKLEVLAWTVDNPNVALRLHKLGVKYLTTNRPDWLKAEVEKL